MEVLCKLSQGKQIKWLLMPQIALIPDCLSCVWIWLLIPFEKCCEGRAVLSIFTTPNMLYTCRHTLGHGTESIQYGVEPIFSSFSEANYPSLHHFSIQPAINTHICPYNVLLEDCFHGEEGELGPPPPPLYPNGYHMFKACRASHQHNSSNDYRNSGNSKSSLNQNNNPQQMHALFSNYALVFYYPRVVESKLVTE